MEHARKWIVLTFVLLLTLSLVPMSAGAENNPVADARDGVVRIVFSYTLDGESYSQLGTGFFVGEEGKPVEFILTNAHVVTASDPITGEILGYADEVEAVFDDYDTDSTVTAKVIKVFNNGVDLAVLRLEAPTTLRKPLKLLSAETVDIMETVYALGFPGIADDSSGVINSTVQDVTITGGSITREQYLDGDVKYLQIDAVISSGNSGGPLVDENGNVVGINSQVAVPDVGTGLGYALCIDYAIEYLETMGYPYAEGQETIGVTPGSDATVPAEAETEPAPDMGLPWHVFAAIGVAAVAIITLAILLGIKSKKKAPPEPIAEPVGSTMPVRPQKSAGADRGRQIVNIGPGSALGGKAYSVRGRVVIGRDSKKCQVVFPAKTPGVSSVHCAAQEIAEGVVITDLGSSYGTFLENGTKLEPNKPYTIATGEAFYLASKDNGFRVK